MLHYYEIKGLAQVLSWKLPYYITVEDVNYHGQIFVIQDCLFWSIYRLKFIALNDLGELIVPLQHENMPSLLHRNYDEKYCGHCFQSVRFPPTENANQTSLLFSQNVLRRFLKRDRSRTKCVGDPQRGFEHGVHHITQPRCELQRSENLPLQKLSCTVWHARRYGSRHHPAEIWRATEKEVESSDYSQENVITWEYNW